MRAAELDPAPGVFYHLSGDVLFEADGVNHMRTLEKIMRRLGDPVPPPEPIKPSLRRVLALGRGGDTLADHLVTLARETGTWVYLDDERLHGVFALAARILAHAEAAVAAIRPRAVVVASTINTPNPRARPCGARRRRAVGLFPHAPLLADPLDNDLPVDFAGLREEELERYAEMGRSRRADGPRRQPDDRAARAADDSIRLDPAVFGAADQPAGVSRPAVRGRRAGAGAGRDRGAHPRADRDLLRSLAPPQWSFWERRTLELLERGPPLLLQHSSGVAVEALYLGIPTIELVNPARPTGYALIGDPHVPAASGLDGWCARRARRARRPRARMSGEAARMGAWLSRVDGETVDRAAALIERAAAEGARPLPIWEARGA